MIVIFIVAICSMHSKDKKSKKQLEKNEEILAKLPDIYYTATDSFFGNLEVFHYTSSNRSIYLKKKGDELISCPLSQLDVFFYKETRVIKHYRITCKNGSKEITFYGSVSGDGMGFTKEQWEVIYSTLTLAGVTRNVAIMGKSYKNMEKATTVLKILSKL